MTHRERRLIDQHFAGRADPGSEQAMRAHLGACAECSEYYDLRTALADLDPAAPPVQARLAAGLGFAPQRPPGHRALAWAFAPVAAALALVAWFIRAPALDQGFAARRVGAPHAPTLLAYRVSPRGAEPLGSSMTPTDELAFAYRNPGGYRRLLVVGVDDRGALYWFHPDPDSSDAAVTIAGGPGRRELPEAIRHQYATGRLHILGLFTNEPLTVSRVAGLVGRSGCAGLRLPLSGGACTELNVLVNETGPP